ncbi:glycosyltransferase [Achromatium sp. WMS2]|nr:glycosyltransferase [Achromatium sp. WMS2]
MKILYFHQHFSTPDGASGTRSYAMAQALIANNHQVTIVCGSFKGGYTGLVQPFLNGKRRGVVAGIDVIEFDLSYSNSDGFWRRTITFVKFAMRSIALVFTENYDILFATTTPLTAGIPGIFARWLRGKPFVFEVRDLWPELPRAMGVIRNPLILWAMAVLEWVSYHSAHRLIGLSPGIVEGIERRGIRSERIALVPNGCDLSIFADNTEPWRPEGIASTDLLAIFTGTHGIANGLDAVIDAAMELQKRERKDIILLLVGQGKLKNKLRSRAKQEGLDNVLFQDPVHKKRLAGLMAGADIGMQILANIPAFYYGTSPNKFFDYIAAGLPVLNNYPGWLAEMIKDEHCGFAIKPDDAAAFADALEYAADNRYILVKMGENAKNLAISKFDRKLLSNIWVNWVIGARKI